MDAVLRIGVLASLLALGYCCSNPFIQVGSQCLFFGTTFNFDYQASADFCEAFNGRLVKIDETQKLQDIVNYTTNNLTEDYSYWIDGTNVQGEWLFSDGGSIPRGTPYWATFSLNGTSYGQHPLESHGTNCVAIKQQNSYYFISNNCDDSISPLCEEITGTPSSGDSSSSCGGSLTSFSGEILSPNYPGAYPAPIDCVWTITRGVDSVIRITVTDVDITCQASGVDYYLSIRDGSDSSSPELGRYICQDTPTPVALVTSGNQAWVSFQSPQNRLGYRGFSLSYSTECVEGANDNFIYSSPTGTVNSPCYPNYYPINLKYTWQISVDEGYYIALTVVSFDTEKDYDIVQIRDGASDDSPILSELSGSIETGYEIISTHNQLFISFTSDAKDLFSNKGFAFIWTERESCPTPYLNVGQMCLHFVFNPLTYGQSGITCEETSGQLAAISDSQDLRDLYVYLQNKGIADTSFWTGGSDQEEEGLWKWKDGTLVTMGTPFWGTTGSLSEVQEPSGGEAENCLLLNAEGRHYFRDASCQDMASAICMHLSQ